MDGVSSCKFNCCRAGESHMSRESSRHGRREHNNPQRLHLVLQEGVSATPKRIAEVFGHPEVLFAMDLFVWHP